MQNWNKKNILFIVFAVTCFLFASGDRNVSDAASGGSPRLGVWVTVFCPEKVLYSKESADRLISSCKKTGIDHIYLQIYRADKAYYDSGLADRTPYENMLASSGEDTVKYIIAGAHKNGLKVYAWMNLLTLSQNKDANILKKFGEEILTKDEFGRTPLRKGDKDELDNYYIRENQLFLEPGDERVRKHLVSVAEEIVRKYPGFDGIHLDYIRYPAAVPFMPGSRFTPHGLSYGYGKRSVENFKKSTGLDINTMDRSRENFKLWDEWRRDQVTALLREISGKVRALSPASEISCTIPPSIERTHLVTLQDWTRWLREGSADYVVIMNYTDDTELMELYSRSMLLPGLEKKVFIGIGAYLLDGKPEILKAQLKSTRELSPGGIVIFSYDEVAKNGDIQEFLAKTQTNAGWNAD